MKAKATRRDIRRSVAFGEPWARHQKLIQSIKVTEQLHETLDADARSQRGNWLATQSALTGMPAARDTFPSVDTMAQRRARTYCAAGVAAFAFDLSIAGFLGAELFALPKALGASIGAAVAIVLAAILASALPRIEIAHASNPARAQQVLASIAVFLAIGCGVAIAALYAVRVAFNETAALFLISLLGVTLPLAAVVNLQLWRIIAAPNAIAQKFLNSTHERDETALLLLDLRSMFADLDRALNAPTASHRPPSDEASGRSNGAWRNTTNSKEDSRDDSSTD